MLKVARVGVVALSLGMLVWFVSRSSGGANGAASEGAAGGASGTNAAGLDVSPPAMATSSKSINQPIFTTKGNVGEPIVAPGSKSLRFDVPIPGLEKTPAAGKATAVSAEASPAPSATATPPVSNATSGVPILAPSSKIGRVFQAKPESVPLQAPTPVPPPIRLDGAQGRVVEMTLGPEGTGTISVSGSHPTPILGGDVPGRTLIAPSSKSGAIFLATPAPTPTASPTAPSPTP